MNSEIFKIRNRGQVVTEGCQWIARHRRLAMQLAVRPILILAATEMVNIVFIRSWTITIVLLLVALVLVPTVPSMAMYVVENKEEYGYPERLPKLFELWSIWKSYFLSAVIIGFIGTIITMFCGMTMVGPMITGFIRDIAIVIHHRNRSSFISVISNAFSLSFTNFASLLLTMLGTAIISTSMVMGPPALIFAFLKSIPHLISPQARTIMDRMFDEETTIYLAVELALVGYILSAMINMVVTHFFYGHAVLCAEKTKEARMARRKEREERRREMKEEQNQKESL